MAQQYTADTILTNENLHHIRHRPTAYIGSKDSAGITHMAFEYVSNSADEVILNPEGGTIHVLLLRDRVKNRFQLVIRDYMRGIPSKSLVNAMTVLGTSGKVNANSAYTSSAGLFGMGSKVAAALSTRYRVISHNYLEKQTASLYLEDGDIKDHHEEKVNTPTGVCTVFEPDLDPKFFVNGAEFMESGYLDLITVCKQMNVFNPQINFQFYIYERSLPEKFWKAGIEEALGVIDDFILRKNREIAYASDAVIDKSSYLFEVWRTNSSIVYRDEFDKDPINKDDRLGYNVKIFFTKKSVTGNPQFFVAVNNVVLVDRTENSATVAFMNILRNKISELQETKELKKFVKEEYRFPTLLLALGIRFNNAELSGVTKTSFKDTVFAKQFTSELSIAASMKEGYWVNLAAILKPDIELRYSQFYDAPLKKTEGKKVFADLNFPNNYKECKSTDNTLCELYIVEGTSAGNITGTRDNEFQAIYETRGKPYNAATQLDQMTENRKRLLKDPIYADLLKILNIGPNTTDMSSARFNKIIIATDADPDGYHIRSIHLNNLYIINPRIIESGMVWLANPPLYSMEISKNKRLFLRDRVALTDARINFIYKSSMDIKISTIAGIIELDGPSFRDMCYLISYLGDQFTQVAKQLNIPLLILERLVLAIEHIYPKVNYYELAKFFDSSDPLGYVRVQLNETGRYAVISVGGEDHIVGLESVGKLIQQHLLPLVIKYKYKEIMYLVRMKLKSSAVKQETPMSPMMLYIVLEQLNRLFHVRRYKGLGEMTDDDTLETIMNPDTRSLTHVTDIGSPEVNYNLLGKNTDERKALLMESNVLSNTFLREHTIL